MKKLTKGLNLINSKYLRWFGFSCLWLLLIVGGQQCAQVDLELREEVLKESYLPDESRLNLDELPPEQEHHRFVFLVDMSRSMITGPCPFDVSHGNAFGFFDTPSPYSGTPSLAYPYDPNFDPNVIPANELGRRGILPNQDPRDGRAEYRFCIRDPNKNFLSAPLLNAQIPIYDITADEPHYTTTDGVDALGSRFEILRYWMESMKNNLSDNDLAATEVLIIPVTGGRRYDSLLNDPLFASGSFVNLGSLKNEGSNHRIIRQIDYLKSIQDGDLQQAQSYTSAMRNIPAMGTSPLGEKLLVAKNKVEQNMDSQGSLLEFTKYHVVHLGDGMISPTPDQIQNVYDMSPDCNVCRAVDPSAPSCSANCSKLTEKIVNTWGRSEYNTADRIEYTYSILSVLPQYYLAGEVDIHFVEINKTNALNFFSVDPLAPDFQANIYDSVVPQLKSKEKEIFRYEANSFGLPPFELTDFYFSKQTMHLLDLFVLNTNVRFDGKELQIDSDADGVIDSEDPNPLVARSNGICLDGLTIDSNYAKDCESLSLSGSCDPKLDEDGDFLNNCEEMLLNTDKKDFDTDDDSIPDYIEWLYGFNPRVSDRELDSNGDGIVNIDNLRFGIGPLQNPRDIHEAYLIDFELNKMTGQFNNVVNDDGSIRFSEDFFFKLNYLPLASTLSVSDTQLDLYRRTSAGTYISPQLINQSLFSTNISNSSNQIMLLTKSVVEGDSSIVQWNLHKYRVDIDQRRSFQELDLTNFELLKVVDDQK